VVLFPFLACPWLCRPIATLLFFALPKAYEKNQTEADKLIAMATLEVNKLVAKLPAVQKISKKAD